MTSWLLDPCSDSSHLNPCYFVVHDFLWQSLALSGVCLIWGAPSKVWSSAEPASIPDLPRTERLLTCPLHQTSPEDRCCPHTSVHLRTLLTPLSFSGPVPPPPILLLLAQLSFFWEWFLSLLSPSHDWLNYSFNKSQCQVKSPDNKLASFVIPRFAYGWWVVRMMLTGGGGSSPQWRHVWDGKESWAQGSIQ